MRKCPCASGGEAMMSEVTIKDIARLCGVGVSTVSRAINDHPDINPTTKKQIQEMIERYGYIPNNSARNLKAHGVQCSGGPGKGHHESTVQFYDPGVR